MKTVGRERRWCFKNLRAFTPASKVNCESRSASLSSSSSYFLSPDSVSWIKIKNPTSWFPSLKNVFLSFDEIFGKFWRFHTCTQYNYSNSTNKFFWNSLNFECSTVFNDHVHILVWGKLTTIDSHFPKSKAFPSWLGLFSLFQGSLPLGGGWQCSIFFFFTIVQICIRPIKFP